MRRAAQLLKLPERPLPASCRGGSRRRRRGRATSGIVAVTAGPAPGLSTAHHGPFAQARSESSMTASENPTLSSSEILLGVAGATKVHQKIRTHPPLVPLGHLTSEGSKTE